MSGKFERFQALHVAGDPLILFNIWDAGSALAVARAGAEAIATGSASVAAANGFDDGEGVPMDFAIANARRIVESVELPVTVDFEGGYANDPEAAATNVAKLAATGAIGCNFEDQVVGTDRLFSVEDQAARIAAIRRAAGPNFFINARTDLFLKAPMDSHDDALVDQAIERAEAYKAAGANGFFVPMLARLKLLERMCWAAPMPVNYMAFPGGLPVHDLAEIGVSRISHGPFPQIGLMSELETRARAAMEATKS